MEDNFKTLTQSILHKLWNNIIDENNFSHKILFTFVILFFGIWAFRGGVKLINKNIKSIKTQSIVYKTVKNLFIIIGTILLLITWINAQNSFLFIIIIIGGISIFSIKNLSTNLVAWFMLLRKKYFKLYDRIAIDNMEGDVIKITPFYFKLIERQKNLSSSTATGRTIRIPNHTLLSSPVYNYNDFTQINWKEVEYHITIDSDWKIALDIIEEELDSYMKDFYNSYNNSSLKKLEKKFELFDENLSFKSYVLLEEDYIKIVGQFPANYRNGTATISFLNKVILTLLQDCEDIELVGKTIHINLD
nr:mechanosensitive ion channel domain-containing protein [Mammaliicoccus lentus]